MGWRKGVRCGGPSVRHIRMVQLYVGPTITMLCGWIVHRRVEHINAQPRVLECSIDGQERSELVIVDPANKSINIGKESSKRT